MPGIIHQFPSGIGEGQLPGQHLLQLPGARAESGLGPKKTLKQRCALAMGKVRMADATGGREHLRHHSRPPVSTASASSVQLVVRRALRSLAPEPF